jgi:hypothetical protein
MSRSGLNRSGMLLDPAQTANESAGYAVNEHGSIPTGHIP